MQTEPVQTVGKFELGADLVHGPDGCRRIGLSEAKSDKFWDQSRRCLAEVFHPMKLRTRHSSAP